MNSRRSFFKTAFKTAGAGIAAMVLPATVLAGTPRLQQKGETVAAEDSTALNKMRGIFNNNHFKGGWGFELTDGPALQPYKDGECPGVSVLIYTLLGTIKWGRTVIIPNELVEDDSFLAVRYFRYHVDRLDSQLANLIATQSKTLLPFNPWMQS
jgi:hypothetical protein